jgi:DNA-binding NtrC family response regulator
MNPGVERIPVSHPCRTPTREDAMAQILVLDDVQEAVDAVCKILEKRGHEVVGYTDEEAAIDHVGKHSIDLAILDIKLRKMDGVQVLGKLKEIRPDVRAIMLTGYPTHTTVEEAMRLGAKAYCLKPIDRSELEKKVDEALTQVS